MESINKFKVLTVVILCLFVFVVGAIYTNTKDESIKKGEPIVKIDKNYRPTDQQNLNDVARQVEILARRVEDLSDKMSDGSSDDSLNCKIYGTMDYNGIKRMSSYDAIQDAKRNNSSVVLTCSF